MFNLYFAAFFFKIIALALKLQLTSQYIVSQPFLNDSSLNEINQKNIISEKLGARVRLGLDGCRAEIFWNGEWGTICDDHFDAQDAITFCKTLGFDRGIVAPKSLVLPGRGPIHLDDLQCRSFDVNIFDCPGSFGVNNCNHEEDVGVICHNGTLLRTQTPTPPPTPFGAKRVRLGSDGVRAEIFWNGQWGTICDDHFDRQDATTFCNTLGFDGGNVVPSSQTVEGFDLPILAANLHCRSFDVNIFNCPGNFGKNTDCNHYEDVGVKCNSKPFLTNPNDTPPIPVRIGHNGIRAEIFWDGQWGTICNDSFTQQDAITFCKTLGFDDGQVVPNTDDVDESGCNLPIVVDDLRCRSFDEDVFDCPGNFGDDNCAHHGAGVKCTSTRVLGLSPTTSPIKTPTTHASKVRIGDDGLRAEIFWNGEWGTICDDGFDQQDAFVFCQTLARQAGCEDVMDAQVTEKYVQPGYDLPVLTEDMGCTSFDDDFFACEGKFGQSTCKHHEDVGVVCSLRC